MIEHLPPGSPWHREVAGTPWLDRDWVLHDISSRLRDLLVLTGNVWRAKGEPARDASYLPTPPREGEEPAPDAAHTLVVGTRSTERAELAALIHRRG